MEEDASAFKLVGRVPLIGLKCLVPIWPIW